MVIILFFRWWYAQGWLLALKDIKKRTLGVSHNFSVPILIKTLFAPWRRLITDSGKSLDEKFKAGVDNLISRFVGFWVRFLVLIIAGVVTALTFCLFLLIAIIWPFMPLAVILLVWLGINK